MCDKKNKVLFTDSECLVLSPDFKLPDENQILLKVPRQNNYDSFNLENNCSFRSKTPIISYIRPFGCHVTILNTIDHLGKFAGKSDEGFLVGYSLQSKAFRVYNLETKRVEENLHINFLENKPNVAGKGPSWLFDLDYLTDSMNYLSVRSENQANLHAGQQESNQNTGTKDKIDAGDSEKEDESAQDCFELPIWHSYSSTNTSASKSDNKRGGPREEEQVFLDDLARLQRQEKEANEEAEALRKNLEQETENLVTQAGAAKSSSTNIFSTVSTTAKASGTNLVNTVSTTAKASGTNLVNTVSIPVSTASPNEGLSLSDTSNSQEDDSEIPPLEDIHQDTTDGIFTHSSYDDEGAEADFTNLETVVNVSPIPTSRINPSHPSALILGDPTSAQRRNNHKDDSHCDYLLFSIPTCTQEDFRSSEDEKLGDAYARRIVNDCSDHVSTSVMIRNIPNGTYEHYRFNKWSVHFPVATGPRNCVVPNRKPKDKPRFNEGAKRLFIKKQHHREIILKLDPSDHVSTSVMIRNIPNNYMRELLVKFHKDHCKTQNEMEENDGKSACNFVYLPIDFKHRLNVEYTFVNFTTSEAVWKSHVCITRKSWPLFKSKKIAQVVRTWI
ncbi:ribonuclease H-like domain-containing protein [Tanacetum coccineum]|uniref:Ribonuclease H-like domain-containing protein n=1 Tax=Tanacetum coccineum TaxID=301880 RepID=A0ABQ5IL21_9ASTR